MYSLLYDNDRLCLKNTQGKYTTPYIRMVDDDDGRSRQRRLSVRLLSAAPATLRRLVADV